MLALLFSGQGAQRVGMGQSFHERSPAARAVFDEAHAILGWDVAELCFRGDPERLAQTRYTQPALFTVEVAILAALLEDLARQDPARRLPVAFAAGHSLGEFAALTAAGALSFADGLRLVARRGELMDQTSQGTHGLLAVSEVAFADVEELRRELERGGFAVDLACHNSPEQLVLAGEPAALERAAERLQKLGGKAVRLKVSGAFHSRWMQPCAEQLAEALAAAPWRPLTFPVVANESARPYPLGRDAWPGLLTRQLTQPVKSLQTVRFLCAQGVTHLLEIGPAPVLSRLGQEILPALRARTLAHVDDLEPVRALLAEIGPARLEIELIGRCLAHAASTRNAAPPDEVGFEQACRKPYRQVMERYQRLLEAPAGAAAADCRAGIEMLQQVMEHKRIDAAERRQRWQEVSWLDRHGLTHELARAGGQP